jgi:hypothetical protein
MVGAILVFLLIPFNYTGYIKIQLTVQSSKFFWLLIADF